MLPAVLGSGQPDRLQLPDVRRPERMPSLPEWVASRIASLRDEAQPDRTGRWRQVATLPASSILEGGDREAIEQHAIALEHLCADTPANSVVVEAAMLVIITKLMMVLPAMTQNEQSAEARGEAFMSALDDIPAWAVQSAIRRWHRSDCGNDARGRAYDYHWCPAPAELCRIAFAEMWRIKGRAQSLRRLLSAEPRIEFTDEHRREMSERLAGLFPRSRTSLVGRNGSGEVVGDKPAEVPTVGRGQGIARPQA